MKIIVFDENAIGWTRNNEHNLMYLKLTAKYIQDLFRARGYIYLNQIYEYFGVNWNPGLTSPCYLLTSGLINFEFEPIIDDVGFIIKIGR